MVSTEVCDSAPNLRIRPSRAVIGPPAERARFLYRCRRRQEARSRRIGGCDPPRAIAVSWTLTTVSRYSTRAKMLESYGARSRRIKVPALWSLNNMLCHECRKQKRKRCVPFFALCFRCYFHSPTTFPPALCTLWGPHPQSMYLVRFFCGKAGYK